MEQMKRNSLNSLKSIIFKLPEDTRVINKLDKSCTVLDNILTKYLDQISYMSDNYNYKFGYNVDTKMINYGTKPFNEYSDIFQPYTYEQY